ncbi:MAG: hypothetical protein NT027_12490 [Proteobacteria bacterium]|nr:hypothetical protein [Pseudomonadota bacterium]
MKNASMIIASILFATSASASYLESCQFDAKVVEVIMAPDLDGTVKTYTPVVKIKIEAAVDQGSHNPNACSSKVGTDQVLISKSTAPIVVDQVLKIDYFYANGRGPNGGMFQSERWSIVQ